MWKSARVDVTTSWKNKKLDKGTKSRYYMLGSFFEILLAAITDPKDDHAFGIKTDPAYEDTPEFKTRKDIETLWKSTRFSSNIE